VGLPTGLVQCSSWLLFIRYRTVAIAPGPCERVTPTLRRAQPDSVPPGRTRSVRFGFDGSLPTHRTSRWSTFPTDQLASHTDLVALRSSNRDKRLPGCSYFRAGGCPVAGGVGAQTRRWYLPGLNERTYAVGSQPGICLDNRPDSPPAGRKKPFFFAKNSHCVQIFCEKDNKRTTLPQANRAFIGSNVRFAW
jgi:hypothetical protein